MVYICQTTVQCFASEYPQPPVNNRKRKQTFFQTVQTFAVTVLWHCRHHIQRPEYEADDLIPEQQTTTIFRGLTEG